MANLFDGGVDLFSTMMGGQPHPGTIDFLSRQFSNVSNNLSDVSRRFQEKAKSVFEKANSSDAMRLARAASRRVKSLWGSDEIKYIRDIGDFQHARLNQQRWIMANPVARELYHEQRLDGYNDSYVDMQPGARGEDHYDYRRVMSGITSFSNEEEDEETTWSATTYFDMLYEEDRELAIDEQMAVLTSWSYLEMYLKAGKEDPTSRLNSDLG